MRITTIEPPALTPRKAECWHIRYSRYRAYPFLDCGRHVTPGDDETEPLDLVLAKVPHAFGPGQPGYVAWVDLGAGGIVGTQGIYAHLPTLIAALDAQQAAWVPVTIEAPEDAQ